jgi:hypothetical protein
LRNNLEKMKFMNRLSTSGSAAFVLGFILILSSGCGKKESSADALRAELEKPAQTTPSAPSFASAQATNQPSVKQDAGAASVASDATSQTPITSNAPAKPLDGSWKLSLAFPNAGITAMIFTFDLKQTGSKITGSATGSVPVHGTIDGHKVSLTETLEGIPTGIDVIYSGSVVDDNTISGTVNFPQYGAGTWTATRQ